MSLKPSAFNIWQLRGEGIYLLNSATRAVARVDQDTYHAMSSTDLAHVPPHAQEALSRNGFLVDADVDEVGLLKASYRRAREDQEYVFMTLLPTMACNFACPYCFESVKAGRLTSERLLTLKRFSSKLFPKKRLVHITVFGGEPLLEIPVLQDYLGFVVSLATEHGFKFDAGITTNGYFLDYDTARMLATELNMVTFQVTIDGCEATHNQSRTHRGIDRTYGRVLENFRSLVRLNQELDGAIDPALRVNLLNNTVEEVAELLEEFSEPEKAYFRVYFRPVYNTRLFSATNVNDENQETFYDLAASLGFRVAPAHPDRFRFCEGDGGPNTLHVLPDLSIWKCVNDLDFQPAMVGRISQDGEIELNAGADEAWRRNDPFEDETCRACSLLPMCWGGCPLRYAKTGDRRCLEERTHDLVKVFMRDQGMHRL